MQKCNVAIVLWKLLLGLFLVHSASVWAEQSDDTAFIQHRSQHAYTAIFGLPAVAARTVQSHEWQLSMEHSSQFMGGTVLDETLLIDGDLLRLRA